MGVVRAIGAVLAVCGLLGASSPADASPYGKGGGSKSGGKPPAIAPPRAPGPTPIPQVPTDGIQHYLGTTKGDDPPKKPPPDDDPPQGKPPTPPKPPDDDDDDDDGGMDWFDEETDDDRAYQQLQDLILELDGEIQLAQADLDDLVQEFLGSEAGQNAAGLLAALEAQFRQADADDRTVLNEEIDAIDSNDPQEAAALADAARDAHADRVAERRAALAAATEALLVGEMMAHAPPLAQEYDDLSHQLNTLTGERSSAQAAANEILTGQ